MAGAIIENMSSRKLAILGAVLLVCQVPISLVRDILTFADPGLLFPGGSSLRPQP